jgi:hypothetical protein
MLFQVKEDALGQLVVKKPPPLKYLARRTCEHSDVGLVIILQACFLIELG